MHDIDTTPMRRTRRQHRAVTRLPRPALVLLVALLHAGGAGALEQETQSWITADLMAPLSERSFLGLRYRGRYSDFLDDHRLDQYQLTANTTVAWDWTLTAGYERFRSPDRTLENRFFPQLSTSTHWFGLPLQHRLRLEVRDITALDEVTYRLRYGLTHTRPLGEHGAYLVLAEEIFFSASEVDGVLDRGFSQNRIGASIGQRIGRVRAELGYQWGYIDSGVVERGDHLIQFRVVFDGRD